MSTLMNTLNENPLMDTDSYKACHWLTYPTDCRHTFLYLESRGGLYDKTVFFGLQAILKAYFANPITHAFVDEMEELFAWHGVPFNGEGFHRVVDKHHGRLPLKIRAVREGMTVPTHHVLMSVENTDPEFFWLPAYFETMLMRLWYMTTVCTVSWDIKQVLRGALRSSSDIAEEQLPFKLHDFGSRGVSSRESAALGGMAHLVNFKGTDTVIALKASKLFYNADKPGFSIPATEHSSIIVWGETHEVDAYRNFLHRFAKPGAIIACVSDSYDIYNAISNLWGGELKEQVISSGATLVIRPDSGNPREVVLNCLKRAEEAFGVTVNSKGYKVLNHVRLIQGDGVNPTSIREIIDRMLAEKYSIDNIAFGMGGALLQKVDRDTQKFAMKMSAADRNGTWIEVAKNPCTDPGKQSKKGRLTLLRHRETGEFKTAHPSLAGTEGWMDVMHTVWENGTLLSELTFEQVRERSDTPFSF